MAKGTNVLPPDRDLHGNDPSLFPRGFQRGLVPQARPRLANHPFAPTLNHPMGHKTIRLVAPSQKVSDNGWLAAMECLHPQ